MTEQDLLIDCIRRLNRAGVEFMLTGSMASNYWGIPRTTHDLDFVVRLSASDVDAVVREFRGDFYVSEDAARSAVREPPHQFNAIDTRSALKVDFWILKAAPFERESFDRRLAIVLLGEPTWISTPEDVVLHKLYWNGISPSERQIGDAAGVVAVQKDDLDRPHLRRWAKELGVSGVLEDLLSGKIRPKST
jgi:hypothetical protein